MMTSQLKILFEGGFTLNTKVATSIKYGIMLYHWEILNVLKVRKYDSGELQLVLILSFLHEKRILLSHRSPMCHLPKERHLPIIMVGPGTGIAPFRSFWQERQVDLQMYRGLKGEHGDGVAFGDMTLYFGCRRSSEDNIYEAERRAAQNEGALCKTFTALSREENIPKVINSSCNTCPFVVN